MREQAARSARAVPARARRRTIARSTPVARGSGRRRTRPWRFTKPRPPRRRHAARLDRDPGLQPALFRIALDSALAQTYRERRDRRLRRFGGRRDRGGRRARARAHVPIRYLRNPTRLRPRAQLHALPRGEPRRVPEVPVRRRRARADCVERLLDAFRAAPDVTLATSRRALIDADGRALAPLPATWPIVAEDALIAGADARQRGADGRASTRSASRAPCSSAATISLARRPTTSSSAAARATA